jgi:D-glycero-D-manno-heptose 1,7-bisphosphate phosphatase
MRPSLVAVDRDGTLIRWIHHLTRADDMSLIPGAGAAIARLNREGIPVALMTNQSVVGRGLISLEQLATLHSHLDTLLAREGAHIDHYLVCPHLPEAGCPCRKPSPYLLTALLDNLGVPPSKAVLIGDTDVDMHTAVNGGVVGLRVTSGIPAQGSVPAPNFPGLYEAVDYLFDSRFQRLGAS